MIMISLPESPPVRLQDLLRGRIVVDRPICGEADENAQEALENENPRPCRNPSNAIHFSDASSQ